MRFNAQSVRIWVVGPKGWVKIKVSRNHVTQFEKWNQLYSYWYDGASIHRMVTSNPGRGEKVHRIHHCPIHLISNHLSVTDNDVKCPFWMKD